MQTKEQGWTVNTSRKSQSQETSKKGDDEKTYRIIVGKSYSWYSTTNARNWFSQSRFLLKLKSSLVHLFQTQMLHTKELKIKNI